MRRLARLAAASVLVCARSVSAAAAAGSWPGALTISSEATAEALRRPVKSNLGSVDASSDSPSATTPTTSIMSAGRSSGNEMAIENAEEKERFRRSLLLRHVGPRLARGDYVGTWLKRPNNLAARVALLVQQQKEDGFQAGLHEITQQLDDVERQFNETTKDMMYILKFVGFLLRSMFWCIVVRALLELASRR